VLVLVLGLAPRAAAAPACTITWTGGAVPPSPNWSNPANWNPARVPGAGDAVCVTGATSEPAVNAPYTVASVQAAVPVAVKSTLTLTDTVNASAFADVDLSAGALDPLGTATIAGTLKWTGGDLGGDGGTTQAASATIAAAADVNIAAGHTLRTVGPVTWSAGSIRMATGARWINDATATAMTSGLVVSPTALGVTPLPQLVNTGTFTAAPGAAPSGAAVQTSVVNRGTMSATSAPLKLLGNYGATTASSGLLSGLEITQTLTPLEGAQLTGDTVEGAMSVPAGVRADATDLTLNAPTSTTFGGDGTLTVAGTLTWSSGTATGNLGIVTAPGSTLRVGSTRLSGASRLETGGSTTFTASGSVLMLGDASWTNRGTVMLGSGTELSSDPGFGGTELELLNLGTISQTSASTTYLDGVFNDGTIAIDRGNLHIDYLHATADSTIAIGIAGSAAGTGYGTLTTYGGLAGTLHVAVDPAYAPAPGTQFSVVSSGPAPDEPFRLTGLDLGGRGMLTPEWTGTQFSGSLKLTAAAASARDTVVKEAAAPAAHGPGPATGAPPASPASDRRHARRPRSRAGERHRRCRARKRGHAKQRRVSCKAPASRTVKQRRARARRQRSLNAIIGISLHQR
jgi:phage baseplate assembly protein gpV